MLEFSYKVNVIDHSEKYKKKLEQQVEKAVKWGTSYYYKELRKALVKTQGSTPISGNLRLRTSHSSPGQIPFVQTFNLANSIRQSYLGMGAQVYGQVYTDVPYAETLEHGGYLNMNQNFKKYTSWRLVNPLKTNKAIAPRPFFTPVWNKNVEFIYYRMQGILNRLRIGAIGTLEP